MPSLVTYDVNADKDAAFKASTVTGAGYSDVHQNKKLPRSTLVHQAKNAAQAMADAKAIAKALNISRIEVATCDTGTSLQVYP